MTEESQRKGATAVLEEIKGIMERAAPKGIIGEAEEAAPGAMLAKAWGGVSKSFAEELKPAIDDFIHMLISAMPAVKTTLLVVADSFRILVEGTKGLVSALANIGSAFFNIVNVGGLLGNALKFLLYPTMELAKAWHSIAGDAMEKAMAVSKQVDEVIAEKTAEKEAREAPEKSAKEALGGETGIYSKERIKSEEEVAKIAAKTDAAHEESARRIEASSLTT